MNEPISGRIREVREYDIRRFGANGNGVDFSTEAIQSAIDQCHAQGGGRVVIPAGRYLTRPLYLRSYVELHLAKDAVLLGSDDSAHYPEWESRIMNPIAPYNRRYLIVAEDEDEIAITGPGCIDGQGSAHYDTAAEGEWWPVKDRATRPGRMVWFICCRDVFLGQTSFIGAPAWSLWVLGCERVRVEGIKVYTDLKAINTDGIDIESSRDVTLSHCDFRTGDDCIVFRANEHLFPDLRPCENVRVESCTLVSRCNAVRFSYWPDGVIRNITLNNLRITQSTRGIICQIPSPLHTPERRTGMALPKQLVVENVTCSNFTVEARQPLWLMLSDEWSAHRLGNFVFENITFTGVQPSYIKGNRECPYDNVAFRNVRFILQENSGQQPAAALVISDADNVSLTNVVFEGKRTGHAPLLHLERAEGVVFSNLTNRTPHPLQKGE